ncbi:MAG: hypothetical protein WC732_09245 [Candidatus Omnitrophota bacterium]
MAVAAARGGYGVWIEFSHTGAECGTPAKPCRIASFGTDVTAAATAFMVGQAGCTLVVDVRNGTAPTPGLADRWQGLTRALQVDNALCSAGGHTLSVIVDSHAGIVTSTLCSTVNGTCATVNASLAFNGTALPWLTDMPPTFGSTAADRVWSPGTFDRVALVYPDAAGNISSFSGNASAGAAECLDTGGPSTADELTAVDVMRAAFERFLGLGNATDNATMLSLCTAATHAMHALATGWVPVLEASLAGARAWAAITVPNTDADVYRYSREESAYFALAIVAIFIGAAIAMLAAATAFNLYTYRRNRHAA